MIVSEVVIEPISKLIELIVSICNRYANLTVGVICVAVIMGIICGLMLSKRSKMQIFLSILGVAVMVATVFVYVREKMFLFLLVFILSTTASKLVSCYLNRTIHFDVSEVEVKKHHIAYIISLVLLLLICGLWIPSMTVCSSPVEFYSAHYSPIQLVMMTFCFYLACILWLGYIYYQSQELEKMVLRICVMVFVISGVLFYFLYGKNYGIMSPLLIYDTKPCINSISKVIGLFILAIVIALVVFCELKHKFILADIGKVGIAVVIAVSVINLFMSKMELDRNGYTMSADKKEYEALIPMSRDGKNVVVIMLDRAIGGYVPYIFENDADLKKQFSGFTCYTNAASLGLYTDLGAPALYGGYEYAPVAMNDRTDMTLLEKHNEALKMLPTLFAQNGYAVTVCDPPYAGYEQLPDLSIFDDCEGVKAYRLRGVYSSEYEKESARAYEERQKNDFVWYSIFRMTTPAFQMLFYDSGQYMSYEYVDVMPQGFAECYSVLDGLDEFTNIVEKPENTFCIIQNEATHEPAHIDFGNKEFLKLYEGEKCDSITIQSTEEALKIKDMTDYDHYAINNVSYQALGKWFDYLREEGIYDNTRIVIASDHGRNLGQFDSMLLNNGVDVEGFSAVLMIKDFDSKEFTYSDEFMTNADVPFLAVERIIDNPVNPFTGNRLDDDSKADGVLLSTTEEYGQGVKNHSLKTFDLSEGSIWRVSKNIFDEHNWELIK